MQYADANDAWAAGDHAELQAWEAWCSRGILTEHIENVLTDLTGIAPQVAATATELTDTTGARIGWEFPTSTGEVAVWCVFTDGGTDAALVAAVTRHERVTVEARFPQAAIPAQQAEAARFVAWAHSTFR
jgi:hypothetical protein